MFILYIVFIFFLILYILIIASCWHHWNACPVYTPTGHDQVIKISVIVAFRNEIANLPACIRSLKSQTYSRDCFEVILADDHSEDGSSEYAADCCRQDDCFRYCNPTAEGNGKKDALIRGVQMASYDLIVLTDADCIMGERWLATIAGFYTRHKPEMIIGLVDIDVEKGFFSRFQELEYVSLTGTGAGAAAMGRPLFCSGANLSFSKACFDAFHDPLYKNVISGDDTFFMLLLKKDNNNQIMLLKSPSAVVVTKGERSLTGFINQRFRWTSKSRYYRDKDVLFTAIVVFMINIMLLASLVMLVTGLNYWLFPVLLIVKTFLDYSFIKTILKFFERKTSPGSFIIYEIIYMIYVLIVVVPGLFFKFRWKGRRYRF